MTLRAGILHPLLAPLLVLAGALCVTSPRGAFLAAAVLLLAVVAYIRGQLVWWDALVLLLAGTLVLDYGFANVGIPGAVGLPVTEIVLAALLLVGLQRQTLGAAGTGAFVLTLLFLAFALCRLIVDYPKWGAVALRDITLPVEAMFLFVGSWAYRTYGLGRWLAALRWIFVVTLLVSLLYPWRETLLEASPTVGLQRPVPLVGNFLGTGTAIAIAFFFFVLTRPFGKLSYILGAACLPLIAFLQLRSLYVILPVVLLVAVALAPRALLGARRRIVFGVAASAVAIGGLMAAAPQGRLGAVSPSFLIAHVSTLSGGEGPSAGSVRHRQEWLDRTLERIDSNDAWVFGLGMGPDLASGFRLDPAAPLVRKPHNDYLEVLARFGLVGLGLFLGAVGLAFRRVVGGVRRAAGEEATFLWWIVCASLVFLLYAATQPLLAYPFGTVPLFLLLGAGLAATANSWSPPRSGEAAA